MTRRLRSVAASVASNVIANLIVLGLAALYGVVVVWLARDGGNTITVKVWMLLVTAGLLIAVLTWLVYLTAAVRKANQPERTQPEAGSSGGLDASPHRKLVAEVEAIIETLREHDMPSQASWSLAEAYNDVLRRASECEPRVSEAGLRQATPDRYASDLVYTSEESHGDLLERARRLAAVLRAG